MQLCLSSEDTVFTNLMDAHTGNLLNYVTDNFQDWDYGLRKIARRSRQKRRRVQVCAARVLMMEYYGVELAKTHKFLLFFDPDSEKTMCVY